MSEYLAGISTVPGQISFWDANSHAFIIALKGTMNEVVTYICFSPDGSKIAAVIGREIELFDLTGLRSASAVSELNSHRVDTNFINTSLRRQGLDDGPSSVSFNNGGNYLVISARSSLHCVDLVNRAVLWSTSIGLFLAYPGNVVFTADDALIVCVGTLFRIDRKQYVALVDADTGELLFTCGTNAHEPFMLALSNNQTTIATCGGRSFVWNLQASKRRGGRVKISNRGQLIDYDRRTDFSSLAFLDDNRLATSRFCSVSIWNVMTCEELHCIGLGYE